MSVTPWLDSDQIVAAIKRRIALPISQETFSNDDLLRFTNEVMFDSQVPSVAKVHEEFYVYQETFTIESNKTRYAIPHRAMWMKLRDINYQDTNNNLYSLTRINPDDRDIYQTTVVGQANPYMFYLMNNDICLTSLNPINNGGKLLLSYFLRPNNLVPNERAFIVNSFSKNTTISNASIVAGDTFTIGDITFTAVSGSPGANEFQIGGSSIATATNLVNAINTEATYVATNQSPATAIVTVTFNERDLAFDTSNTTGFVISSNLMLNGSNMPSNITNSSYIDFLQTKPGHKIYSYGYLLGVNAVSSTSLTIPDSDVPNDFEIGDYVCSQYECIIPQLPPELHSLLVERACERILNAQGDLEQLQAVQAKIAQLEQNQDSMVDNRVDGAPMKIVNKNSLINIQKYRVRSVF